MNRLNWHILALWLALIAFWVVVWVWFFGLSVE